MPTTAIGRRGNRPATAGRLRLPPISIAGAVLGGMES